MDNLTKEQRRKTMSRIRSRDTQPELMLRKALWRCGLRYRTNCRKLPGTPDIVLARHHAAVFVDGDFWHARGHQDNPGEQIEANKEYWHKKLCRNVERDREADRKLAEAGWTVLRIWEGDIKKNLQECVAAVCRQCGKQVLPEEFSI